MEKENDNTLSILLCDNIMTQALDEWDYSKPKRYKNYLAVVTRNSEGEYHYTWLKESRECDEFFNVTVVNEGDILLCGCKDVYKKVPLHKRWYGVMAKSKDTLTLVCGNTYNAVKKIVERADD